MIETFRMFAAYNAWANRLVYKAAADLPPEERQMDKGAFFGSILNTLNHVLLADRVWMYRFTGEGSQPTALDTILYPDFDALRQARIAEDARIIAHMDTLTPDRLSGSFTYSPVGSSDRITQRLSGALSHVFNHQTHHRGQCHMTLTALGKPSLGLDLIYFLRSEGGAWR
nr:DinB family protein [uncultured Gellertiella sp.]